MFMAFSRLGADPLPGSMLRIACGEPKTVAGAPQASADASSGVIAGLDGVDA
jgi:hypothetical protein